MARCWLDRPSPVLLNLVREVERELERLGEEGKEVASGRHGGYRSWDPEVLRADLVGEELLLERLREAQVPVTLLSEEAGVVQLDGEGLSEGAPSEPIRLVVDPFDGSLLYRNDLRFLWAVAYGVWYGQHHRGTCVRDLLSHVTWVGEEDRVTEMAPDGVERELPDQRHAPGARRLADAYLATYLMKPHYLRCAVTDLFDVLNAARFVLPIGGPLAWAYLASGRIDAYIAYLQPLTEVYSALGIATSSGCIVTDLDGRAPTLVDDVNQRYTLVAARDRELHREILQRLAEARMDADHDSEWKVP